MPIAGIVAEHDWNFDGVPDDELAGCCYWEYARESVFIRDTLREYREWYLAGGEWNDQRHKLDDNLVQIQSIEYFSEVFLRGCAFPEGIVYQSAEPEMPNFRHKDAPIITGSFPAPWQSLSQAERRERAQIRSFVQQFSVEPIKLAHWSWAKEIVRECQQRSQDQHAQRKHWEQKYLHPDEKGNGCLPTDAPPPPRFPEIRPRTRWGVAEALVVEIAWDHFTNDEIARHFRKWVRDARPKECPVPDDKGRNKPGDLRANLTKLAVMRLLARFPALKLVDSPHEMFPAIWKTKQFSGAKWLDVTKWHDARRGAEKVFHTLFPFLQKDEKPISWVRPSRGK